MKVRMQGEPRELAAIAGDWYTQDISILSTRIATGTVTYILRYRDILASIRFFLGHLGFADDLIYEPYRMWSTDEPRRRVYSDMALADWWWETQQKVNIKNATIIPLIISSDKT